MPWTHGLPARTAAEVQASLRAKSKPGPNGCRLWTAAVSQSGWRAVFYPLLKVGGRPMRVNRLVLLLEELDPDLPFLLALREAARRHPKSHEAAHSCDTSLCINRAHLDWKSHGMNLQEQVDRRRAREDDDLDEARAVADELRAERLRRQGAWA